MTRRDRTYLREDGSRIYTRRFSGEIPTSFHAALVGLATERGESLSALVLPWIEDGLQGKFTVAEPWPEEGSTRQLTVRLPRRLHEMIRGEGRRLPYKKMRWWIVAGYRREMASEGLGDWNVGTGALAPDVVEGQTHG